MYAIRSYYEIGMLSSTFGFTSLMSYAPGGWLADRYPARKLMGTALAISGLGGLVFARIPPFEVCLVLYGLCVITSYSIHYTKLYEPRR